MRVIALLATYNERRFVGRCIEHLHGQGVDTYLIDNCSTDDTVEIAEGHRGRGLIGSESFPRDGVYRWRQLLRRKEELARELDADWFIHVDADELRLPPSRDRTLAEAFAAVDREGYNAVNFLEFTFVPTREDPDHDHDDYRRTLRTYYPFSPRFPHKVTAWKATPDVDLATSGGHRIDFAGRRIWPSSFPMKHYLFLSRSHAVEKYVERRYDADEVASGWHGWRAELGDDDVPLPAAAEVRVSRTEYDLDPAEPWKRHYIDRLP